MTVDEEINEMNRMDAILRELECRLGSAGADIVKKIERMQAQLDALMRENAELKSKLGEK